MNTKHKCRIPPYLSRSVVSESIISQNLLGDFVARGSRGESLIEELTGMPIESISKKGLSDLAAVLSRLGEIKINRNIYRRKDLLIKWFQDNEEVINALKSYVTITF